ncbi:MAG: PEP-CTERM sorting domain-containing protein [Phycisphaerales bacterium]
MNKQAKIVAMGVCVTAGAAGAGEVTFQDPGIFSPFDNAQVEFVWMGSIAGYTGELSWVDNAFEAAPQMLWNNKAATTGDTIVLPRLFSQGERVDLNYSVIVGNQDSFSTAEHADWSQFTVEATNPLDVLVGVEDIRYPAGDMDHNDASFRVVFSEVAVPAPGSMLLLGGGCLVMARRRR